MTLRTPRRRISPRTKRRYRAIKQFFRKALGSTSQPEIQLNSSITDNVSDLKHKILGLEQQLSEVSKHCRDIIRLESSSQRESQTYVSSEQHGTDHDSSSDRPRQVETKLLYNTAEGHYRNTEGSDYISTRDNIHPNVSQNYSVNDYQASRFIKPKKKNSKVSNIVEDYSMNPNYSRKKTQNFYENVAPVYSTSSFHSLSDFSDRIKNPGIPSFEKDRKHNKIEKHSLNQRPDKLYNGQVQKNYETFERYYDKRNRNKKMKHSVDELDQDFIADIIKRQYKPVKMFDRRESNLSQVSEPVCRDHEFHMNENIQESSELCSCCYGRHHTRRAHHSDHSDTRSVCDARLYRSKRMSRVKQRRVHPHAYNDSELYDLVPVKEHPSPKSKRKVFQERVPYSYYKEVPPSPKSHRPRLNLKAQYYTASEDHIDFLRNSKRISPTLYQKHHEISEAYDSDESEELPQTQRKVMDRRSIQRLDKADKNQQIQEDNVTLNSLRYKPYANDSKNINDSPLNKTLDSDISDEKTDRALCEIKDILQCFLQEIKKEASSQSGKSELGTKIDRTEAVTSNQKQNMQVSSGVTPNSGHSFNNYSVPQCAPPAPPNPYMPAFPNPCCYPMLPVCPINCMQNSYVVPSSSYTCGNCTTKLDETVNKSTSSNAPNDNVCSETDELIKEIYKFVAQSPTFSRKQDDVLDSITKRVEQSQHKLTSRSVGGSTQICRHDANVGTSNIRSYSKSCEAIGSRMISDYYSGATNASYSETGLENVSVETSGTTKSSSATEISTEISEKEKATKGKFAGILRSLGLFKKKRDAIEEEDESESSIEAEMTRRGPPPSPPFRQHITNYAMYDQQTYRPPPMIHRQRPEYAPERSPPYNPGVNDYHMSHMPDPMHHPMPYYPGQSPSAPPYSNYDYHQPYSPHDQPQPPLCLKEIEVKSIGCQSERKLSFFRKIKKKVKQPEEFENQAHRNFSTQTTQTAGQTKPGLFGWRPSPKFEDPIMYSFKAQKRLAEGDIKMRNAMLKKMFYKKNPFSPNNLIIRTLLGKDKSSWGEAPIMHKPRMFL